MGTLDATISSVSMLSGGRVAGTVDPASSVSAAASAAGQGSNAPPPRSAQTAVALAATLTGLLEGALIEALVLGHDHDGGTVLKTPIGTFVAPLPATPQAAAALAQLPPHSRVLLEALAIGDLIQARLVAVDGEPPTVPGTITLRLTVLLPRAAADVASGPAPRRGAEAPHPPVAARPAPPLAVQLQAAAASVAVSAGQNLVGVLQTTPHPPATGSGAPHPAAIALGASAPYLASLVPGGAPLHPATAAAAAGLPHAALPGGSTISLRVVAVVAPGAPPPSVPDDAMLGEIAVEDGPDHDRLVLRLPGGTLRLPPNVLAPPGTRLLVELLATAPPTTTREPEQERLIGELQAVLAGRVMADPAAAARSLERLPAPGHKFAAAALLFLAAARHGDLSGWLDAAAPRPADGANDTEPLKRLAAAWQAFGGEAEADKAAPEAWRPWLIPMFDGIGLRPLMFQLRRRSAKAEGGVPETRFLLDLDLSALGALQLDGLIRPQRFDLILRGAGRIDATMRRELSGLFQQSLEIVGYAGGLSFQVERPPVPKAPPRTVLRA